jgi:hypothetical protein
LSPKRVERPNKNVVVDHNNFDRVLKITREPHRDQVRTVSLIQKYAEYSPICAHAALRQKAQQIHTVHYQHKTNSQWKEKQTVVFTECYQKQRIGDGHRNTTGRI